VEEDLRHSEEKLDGEKLDPDLNYADPQPWLSYIRIINSPLIPLHLFEDVVHKYPLLLRSGKSITPLLHHPHKVVILLLYGKCQISNRQLFRIQ
jgi:hypothetical protein